jgi:predicted flap endonuclease-1-like 5' DNA nuclease
VQVEQSSTKGKEIQMAARASYIGDGTFTVLMSFIFAAIFGLGIGFAYAVLQEQGWAAGSMIAGAVAVVGGGLLSFVLTRKPLPPPNTVAAPVAPKQGAYFVAGGATGVVPTGSSSGETISDRIGAALGGVTGAFDAASDKVKDAAAAAGAKFDKATEPAVETVRDSAEAVGETVQETADGANQRVRDAAKAAGEAARFMSEPVAEATAESDDAPRGTRPDLLPAARDGGADDLKKIKGVGPKLEGSLNEIGVWHFDQIASWNADEVAWVDTNLVQFKGRCSRDEWVAQAKILAAGGETEFSERVDKGDVY